MLSLPIDYLRNTIASSSSFQTWTGTASEALAKPRVHVSFADNTATLPLTVVYWAPQYQRIRHASDNRSYFSGAGALRLLFRDAVTETDETEAAYDFMNEVGAVLADMEAVSGSPTYLDITSIILIEGPARPEESERDTLGDFYAVMFNVELQSI